MARVHEARHIHFRERRRPVLHRAAVEVVGLRQRLGHGQALDPEAGLLSQLQVHVQLALDRRLPEHGQDAQRLKYHARMAVEFFVPGKARWVVGWFGINGGTVPYWQFPAVFPYL